ncbi:MAG: Sec-independent protein translocase protein TatB [Actinomycetota bacterium]|nr:Sec-independent protein translocase protein TatB [Actinomycetota bacterium]
MPTSLGPAEILVILVVALIVLGPKRLPEAGRQVGKALAEVRRWSSDVKSEIRTAVEVEPPGFPPPAPEPPPGVGAEPPPAATPADAPVPGSVPAPVDPSELPGGELPKP